MSVANLLNIPTDREGFAQFSFANQDSHILIVRRAFSLLQVKLQLYPLDPMPLDDLGAWARMHQAAHTEMNAALGLANNDFSTVDFTQPDQLASWIRLHFENHQQASDTLHLT